MNKIIKIAGSINCPHLKELVLSDNLIKDIHPFMLSKLPKLKTLDLSINQISVIENIHQLKSLQVLNLRQNSIAIIENLS